MFSHPISSVAAPPAPSPVMRTDLRPTADTAALVRDPQPDIPLPVPASISQKSTVTQAKMSSPPVDVSAIQRVLKPYGVVMLPQGPAEQPAGKKADVVAGTGHAAMDIPQQTKAAPPEDTENNAAPPVALSTHDTDPPETGTQAL